MSDGLNKLAEGLGEAIRSVPELYQDAFQPTTQETGKTLSLIPRTINAALLPLRQWIAEREYKLAETEKLLAKKLEHVCEDKIVTPEAYVAVPALQAISYSMNSEELRELYANLLAKAMNSDTKDLVHPSFVEIIKQMSPMDAKIFKEIVTAPACPLISIKIRQQDGGEQFYADNCSWISDYSLVQCRTSFDNLTRLGLIQIPSGLSYTHKELYNLVKSNPLFIQAENECKNNLIQGQEIIYIEEFIKMNDLCKLFYNICVQAI